MSGRHGRDEGSVDVPLGQEPIDDDALLGAGEDHAAEGDAAGGDAVRDDASQSDDEDPGFAALLRAVATTPTMLAATTLGRYRIDGVLGAGGMGVVYAAHDTRLARDVALKVLVVPDAARVLDEARAAAALQHEGVCAIYDSGVIDDTPFLALERIDGETLRDTLSRGPVDEQSGLALARELAAALAHVHARGLVHGDIKPENIMRTRAGRAKILDLGLAAHDDDDGPGGGTPGYMARELTTARAPRTPASDVYALGVVIGEVLTATRGTALLGLAPDVRALVLSCVDDDPARRPRDGAALVARIDALRLRRARRRATGLVSIGALALALFVALVPLVVTRVAGRGGPLGARVDVGLDAAGQARFEAGASALFAGDLVGARAALLEVVARGSAHPYPALLLRASDPVGAHTASDIALVVDRARGRDRAHDIARLVVDARGAPIDAALVARARALALALDEDDVIGRFVVATALSASDRDDDAAREAALFRLSLLDALERDHPGIALVALHRAWTHMKRDEGARARAILDEAAERAPGNRFVARERAEAHMSEDPTRALAILDELVATEPSDAFARLMRVEARALIGDLAGARDELTLVLDGPFAPAVRARGALVFALFFSSRALTGDARALLGRALALVSDTASTAELPRALVQLEQDARALGDDAWSDEIARERAARASSLAAAPALDPAHLELTRLLALDDDARRAAARALVATRDECAARSLFFSLGCRSALARAALVLVEHPSDARDLAAARAVLALFPDEARAPTLDALRARLAASVPAVE